MFEAHRFTAFELKLASVTVLINRKKYKVWYLGQVEQKGVNMYRDEALFEVERLNKIIEEEIDEPRRDI